MTIAARKPLSARRSGRRAAALAALVAGLVLARPARAEIEINPYGWKFPNVLTAAKEVIRISDRTPAIPGKETILRGYRKADGTRFLTYEIEGRVFGVQFDTDGHPPFEYSIFDSDGDGKFETKIIEGPGNKDKAYVPQWMIDYYYERHPDLKNAGGGAKVPAPSINVMAPPPTATPPPAKVIVPPREAQQQTNP